MYGVLKRNVEFSLYYSLLVVLQILQDIIYLIIKEKWLVIQHYKINYKINYKHYKINYRIKIINIYYNWIKINK